MKLACVMILLAVVTQFATPSPYSDNFVAVYEWGFWRVVDYRVDPEKRGSYLPVEVTIEAEERSQNARLG